jgi:S-adenosyl methyltransferase
MTTSAWRRAVRGAQRIAQAHTLLSGGAGLTEYIDADLRDTAAILDGAARLLDFTKPVAVTMLMLLHVIPEPEDPYAMVARVMDAMPPGSYLAVSHLGAELLGQEQKQGFEDVVKRQAQQQYFGRSSDQMMRFFAGTDLIEPGLVRVEEWHPTPSPAETGRSAVWCALGRKP